LPNFNNMTKIYNCLWFAFIWLVKSLLKHSKKHHTHKMSGIFHHRLTPCASMYNYLLLYTHMFYMQHNTSHHMYLHKISSLLWIHAASLHLNCYALPKLLCTSYYFKPVFVCIQYDFASFTCCFMTYLKALILNISFFYPITNTLNVFVFIYSILCYTDTVYDMLSCMQ